MKNTFTATLLLCLIILGISVLPVFGQSGNYEIKRVMIDPGHGGRDPGALGKKSKEKNLTLAISLKLGKYIEENIPGVKVEYTRKTDVFVDLGRRAEMANEAGSDVFISIHINASKNPRIYGSSTYINGTTKDAANLEIQKQENGGEDLRPEDYISFANIQQANHENSALLAGLIQNQFRTRAGRRDLGVKQACFAVLWRTNMTAVLVECGFISNAAEERYMMTDDGQAYLASAIYRAFKEYKRNVEGKKASPVINKPEKPATQENSKPVASESATQKNNNETKVADKEKDNAERADSDIYFRVQVKWSKEHIAINSKNFAGLKNVEEIKINNLYKYTVGKTQDFNEIVRIQSETRKKVKDAFVIATRGNESININDAKKALGIK